MFGFLKKLFGGVDNAEVENALKSGAIILDVRTDAEWKSGHIKGAQHIVLNNLSSHINKLKKQDKAIVTYCRSGRRSGMAASMLKNAGIEAYNGGAMHELQRKL